MIIFLVDDDTDDQEIFCNVLENISTTIECFTAVNGHEALQKLISGAVKPDLIFLDLNMPLMNGKEFLRAIKKMEGLKQIPVIILSTSSDSETIHETKMLGAKDFVTKPDKFSMWEKILRDLLSTGPSM